ncbi:hypothetical protein CR513_31953, partial [Mucuna pruriens]
MIGNVSMFLDLKPHEGTISFGGSVMRKIIGIGKVGKHYLPIISNVLDVDELKYNLLSINQFCDGGHHYLRFLGKLIFFVMHVKKGNKSKVLLNKKNIVFAYRPLELLHLDLCRPARTPIFGGKKCGFVVIINDYSRSTWIYILSHKHESYEIFEALCKRVQNEKGICIFVIISDHGKEFENVEFKTFYEKNGIFHNFSLPRIPQQNGVVERKNNTLQEMARTMLCENSFPKHF